MRRIKRFLDLLFDNWTILIFWISILATLITFGLTLIFPSFNASAELFITFGYSAGISIFLLLLEIRKLFKQDIQKPLVFNNMNAAQPAIFNSLVSHLKQRSQQPLILRIYGMRLFGISRTIMDFINASENIVWNRNLDVYIYHCDPDYLETLTPGNMDEESKIEINTMFKEHSKGVLNVINILKRINKTHKHIKIHFRKYNSIPSFWAYEINRNEVYFGYFTWINKDWIGPENNCIFIDKHNEHINGFVRWINNYLDALENWSVPYK